MMWGRFGDRGAGAPGRGLFELPGAVGRVEVAEVAVDGSREGRSEQFGGTDDADDLATRARPSLARVLNGTGVVLHTNLGRAPLAEEAQRAQAEAAGYGNVELSLETGGHAQPLTQPRGRAPAPQRQQRHCPFLFPVVPQDERGRRQTKYNHHRHSIGGSGVKRVS